MPPGCALLDGFAIGARVALLWQHSANAKCQRVRACTRSMPSCISERVIITGIYVCCRTASVTPCLSGQSVDRGPFSDFSLLLGAVSLSDPDQDSQ